MRIISLALIVLLAMTASAEMLEAVSNPGAIGIDVKEATQKFFWNDETLTLENKGIRIIEDMLNLFLCGDNAREYEVGADEIALIIHLNTEEDIGLLVLDYSADGREQSGGISNADKTELEHDEQLIWIWNREDLECSADVINLTIRFRIITEYIDPNYENLYPDSLTRTLAPISFEARFGEAYSFVITGDRNNGYQLLLYEVWTKSGSADSPEL
jgi:uncharacterized protein YccT (UPF0319 family)